MIVLLTLCMSLIRKPGAALKELYISVQLSNL